MKKIQGTFPSSDGENTVHYTVWMPDGSPRGIVQIVHGMVEYVGRYDELARYLAGYGLIVCGHDHLGHGDTAKSPEDYGFFGAKDGDVFLVKDVERMRQVMRKKYPRLPYIILGHSMGSFITRAYAAAHPDAADGIILSGTAGGGQPFLMGIFLCNLVALFCGRRHRSKLIKNLAFFGYNRRFEGNTGAEWVTNDPERLAAYVSDPRCSFTFTVRGYHDLFTLLRYVNSAKWYEKMPKNVPIFLYCGSDDPVGNYSKGPREVADRLREQDLSDVKLKVYPGERHEVHSGLSRNQCYADIRNWIDGVIGGVMAARTEGRADG